MRRLTSRVLLLVLLANLFLPSFTSIVLGVSHPRNMSEAASAQFKGIIEPDNPVVLQKLHSLCPTIDEEHFTSNLLAVYTDSMLIPYAYDQDVYGRNDYWQTAEETITLGRGDCEDQAINLATLVEALYKQTYGYIPLNLVWVVVGTVQTSSGGGGHGWVIINEGLLPRETANNIMSVTVSQAIINIVLGGVAELPDEITKLETTLDLSELPSKSGGSLSVVYAGEKYFELEPTWNLPISEFHNKKYPYTKIWAIFNSQTFQFSPTFYPISQTPIMGAEIRNLAFPPHVTIGDKYTVNVTVQNYELGLLGADLVVILKRNGNEVTRQNTFVWKYIWQTHTFVFQFIAVDPAGDRVLSVELYHDNWGTLELKNYKNFTITALPLSTAVPPQTTTNYDGFWHNTDFTISLSATDSNEVYATYYKINNGSTKSVITNGQPLITTEGTNTTLEYWSVDIFGNEESPHKIINGIKLDKSEPTGSILINQGTDETNNTAVNLTLSAEDSVSGVSQMRFSNDDGTWSSWETYSTSKSWTLSSSDGTKTVQTQFKNGAGLESTIYSDTIILDTSTPLLNYDLTVSVNGSGITSLSTGIHTYTEGTHVVVIASASSGWTFSHWVLDSVNVGSTNPYTVTMNEDHSLTAVFTEDSTPTMEYNLTISVSGSGLTSPVVGVHSYEENSFVVISAIASEDWIFSHWLLDSVNVGSTNPYTVSMNSDHALTAVFSENPVELATNNIDVVVGDNTYVVQILSNSDITDFQFNPPPLSNIRFDVEGETGTSGICNITIPAELMSGEFEVYIGETLLVKGVDFIQTNYGTHCVLCIDYEHSTHTIIISATTAIPEFPSWILLPLFLTVTLVVIIYRKKLTK